MEQEVSRRKRVRDALMVSGVVVVMNKGHVKSAEDIVTLVQEIWKAELVPEVTFRIDEGILKEAAPELQRLRDEDSKRVLGIGSVINYSELEAAIAMGFDMIVSPCNIAVGHEYAHFTHVAHKADVFAAPAAMTPTEFRDILEPTMEDFMADAIKVFPANTHGPGGMKGFLAPFVRDRHKGKIIMPTGGVDATTGPQYHMSIASCGFTPVLGMSAPLEQVNALRDEMGLAEACRWSLKDFMVKFTASMPKVR